MYTSESSFWRYKVYADIRRGSLGRGRQTTVRLSTTAIFSVFAGYFFGNFRDEASVIIQLNSDMQSVVSFSVIPKCMTLDGYFALSSVSAPVWLAPPCDIRKIIARNLIKIDTYCQRRKPSSGTLVSGNIRFAQCTDIRSGSLERRC